MTDETKRAVPGFDKDAIEARDRVMPPLTTRQQERPRFDIQKWLEELEAELDHDEDQE
jgi:hypothetical protein